MAITIDIGIGDTILGGKFKNKRIKVKEIGTDDHGMPTINGRKVVNFRIPKPVDEKISDKPSKTKRLEGKSTYKQIMEI